MRTTVSIEDRLLAAAKQRARALDLTLGQLVEAALQRELARNESEHAGPPVPIFREGRGPRPGVDVTSNRALQEALDDAVALDELR